MDGLTGQAVLLLTDRAREEVDKVFVDAPAWTVGGLAVEAVAFLTLSSDQTPLKVLLIHTGLHQLTRSRLHI